ncbi:MAG: HlyD family efflux transporter periplasmic adaptor subunit [Verrucomicrobiia bacterium]
MTRPRSPLTDAAYLTSADDLPRALPPFWLKGILLFTLLGLLLALAVSLIGPMDEYVVATGEVRPLDYTLIFSPANGVLHEMLVEDGDEVQPNQVVARLWILPEQVAIDPGGLKPFDITSPAHGRVLSTARILQGERVTLGSPLVKLVRGDAQTIRLFANEDRIDRIVPGLEVRFRVRSNPDRLAPFARARVTRVARDRDLSLEDQYNLPPASYYIRATIEDAPYPIPFGAQLDAEILLEQKPFWKLLLLRPHRGETAQR